MTDDPLLTYNTVLDRDGYFCEICGHEANNANGLEQYEHCDNNDTLNICISRCLS